MTDIETLYNMARTALDEANEALREQRYQTYPTYVREYNRLASLAVKLCDEDAHERFTPMDAPAEYFIQFRGPEYLADVKLRFVTLVSYLHDKLRGQKGHATSIGVNTEPIEPDYVFVLMSMDESKPMLEDVHTAIKEVCQSLQLRAERADDIEHAGRITDKILERINAANVLVADLTYERPNVYYELGFAHGINRQVIMIAQEGTSLHFDIQDFNVIFYENITRLRQKLKKRLKVVLTEQA
jgi:hypothetical protein